MKTVNDPSIAQFAEYISGNTISVMSNEGIGQGTLIRMLAYPELPPIHEITIRDQHLTAPAVSAIMTSDSTAQLRSLHLSGNPIGDAGLTTLASSPRLAQIETLQLQKVGATSEGIAALAASPHLKAKNLALGWQEVGDSGAIALVAATEVTHLRLEAAHVGAPGAMALISNGQFESVTLIDNPIHLDGLVQVSPHIKTLNLIDCNLNLGDIRALSAAPAPGLVGLSIKRSAIEDPGLDALRLAPWFAQLESLDVSARHASISARRSFIDAYGSGRFLSIYTKDL